jgi:hypothetical protein
VSCFNWYCCGLDFQINIQGELYLYFCLGVEGRGEGRGGRDSM